MSTCVVMITCEKYKQAWEPFFVLFNRYWKDCPYKLYMITDFGNYNGTETISFNKDFGFSSNLIKALNSIEETNIIYFQEDYLFTNTFDTNRILFYDEFLTNNKIGCLRLAPCPGPTSTYDKEPSLGVLNKGDSYRVSTQTAIWDKSVLLKLLKENESGRDFEVKGTIRSNDLQELFLSVWREQTPTPYYITAIVNGRWHSGAIDLLKKEGLSLDNIGSLI